MRSLEMTTSRDKVGQTLRSKRAACMHKIARSKALGNRQGRREISSNAERKQNARHGVSQLPSALETTYRVILSFRFRSNPSAQASAFSLGTRKKDPNLVITKISWRSSRGERIRPRRPRTLHARLQNRSDALATGSACSLRIAQRRRSASLQ